MMGGVLEQLRWATARAWCVARRHPLENSTSSLLKLMAPGHFCPDVCGLEDFGPADYMRGRVVRAFFRLMALWPHPRARGVVPPSRPGERLGGG